MASVTREDGHLIVAAIRILEHREERAPRPEEVASLLRWPPELLRLRAAALADAGVLSLVESAFDTHLEIRDHRLLDALESAGQARALDEDLAAFERRKEEEADRMSRLFAEGEHERRQQERIRKMDEELRDFRQRKPRSPFGDDSS